MKRTIVTAAVKAAKARDQALWAIGEALLIEADGSRNGPRGLKAVADELAEHGLTTYDATMLRRLRRTSEAFPLGRRHSGLPWLAHCAAGSPGMLDAIVKGATEKVTVKYIRLAVKGWRWTQKLAERQAKGGAS